VKKPKIFSQKILQNKNPYNILEIAMDQAFSVHEHMLPQMKGVF